MVVGGFVCGFGLLFLVIVNDDSLGKIFRGGGGSLHGFKSMAGIDSYPAVVPCLICIFTKHTVPQNGQKNVPVAMALLHFLFVHNGNDASIFVPLIEELLEIPDMFFLYSMVMLVCR